MTTRSGSGDRPAIMVRGTFLLVGQASPGSAESVSSFLFRFWNLEFRVGVVAAAFGRGLFGLVCIASI